jgi:hypothetical protein
MDSDQAVRGSELRLLIRIVIFTNFLKIGMLHVVLDGQKIPIYCRTVVETVFFFILLFLSGFVSENFYNGPSDVKKIFPGNRLYGV